jgi:pyruvate dehydrogenase E2 component (dihydrolipoamide acetyltransferase)
MILPPIPAHRVLATPAVRKLAQNSGVDLNALRGSGPYGRVLRSDVEAARSTAAAPPSMVAYQPVAGHYVTRGGPTEEIPVRGLRKRISQQMSRSKFTAPHFTYVEEVDMGEVVELRKSLKGEADKLGVSLSYLPFIFKAIIPALKKFPQINASLDDARGVIIHKQYYNFGISVAAEEGLSVPVVKNVDKLDIWQIAAELSRLATATREKKIKVEELQDSTFTVTSVGNIGGVLATPIIHHPEVAIMGVFKIRETPVVRDGKVVVRPMMYLATSFDHRVVDGDVAAHFTNMVVSALQSPRALLEA